VFSYSEYFPRKTLNLFNNNVSRIVRDSNGLQNSLTLTTVANLTYLGTSQTAAPTPYIIIPNHNTPQPALDAFTDKLKAETDPNTLWVSGSSAADYIGFWHQSLNSTQVANYKTNPAVSFIFWSGAGQSLTSHRLQISS
jgi:hypothetical protein